MTSVDSGKPAVYLGDGLRDLKAARELRIEFAGIGTRCNSLLVADATAVFPDFRNHPTIPPSHHPTILNYIENLKPL